MLWTPNQVWGDAVLLGARVGATRVPSPWGEGQDEGIKSLGGVALAAAAGDPEHIRGAVIVEFPR